MDFFVYSRDAVGTEALRDDDDLLEQHWSYMNVFAGSMVARGPTFRADRETVTGSLHVLGLPSVDAARNFVPREPNNRAGVYGEHFVWRFENLLGRQRRVEHARQRGAGRRRAGCAGTEQAGGRGASGGSRREPRRRRHEIHDWEFGGRR